MAKTSAKAAPQAGKGRPGKTKPISERVVEVQVPQSFLDDFGTTSDEFAVHQFKAMGALLKSDDPDPLPPIRSMMAVVKGAVPKNEPEAALAVQMAATHQFAMALLGRASRASTLQQMEANGNLANKMLRTYAVQMETLARVRRKGEQKVKVEHVHVYPGGQAVVGNVTTGGGDQDEKQPQPHAPSQPDGLPALEHASVVPLFGEDAGRDGLPVASGAGEEAMPNARRRQG